MIARSTALPRLRGPLCGRAGDLEALERLARAGARVTTIVGPGGVGKTSLALAFAATGERATAFVDLAAARDEDAVALAIAAALAEPAPAASSERWRLLATSI